MLPGVLTWPWPLLTLKSRSPPKFRHFSPDLVRSDTHKDAHQQTRLQTVFTQCSHSGAAWLLVLFFFFFRWWWMRRAVQRSGTNAVNTFPARRGRLNRRDCPRLSWLTESFGPRFWQEQALWEENMVEMCILRRLVQSLFVAVYKSEHRNERVHEILLFSVLANCMQALIGVLLFLL